MWWIMNVKNRKVTVLLDDSSFEEFEIYCEENGFKKSTLICKLISDLLESKKQKSKVKSSIKNPLK